MFKIGDLVEVHNPDAGYKKYRNLVGKVEHIVSLKTYQVYFTNNEHDYDYFHEGEIRNAKSRIVLNIINDL